MNCPKCTSFVEDGTSFCPKCGAPVCAEVLEEELEKTMAIPVIRTTEKGESIGSALQTPTAKPKTQQDITKPKHNIGRWQTFVIAFLITVTVCLALALVYVLLQRETLPDAVSTQSNITDTKPKVEDETKEKDDKELKDGESVGVDDEVYGIRIDREYPFNKGVSLKSEELSYKTLKGADYRCDIPSEFEFVYEKDGEIRYASINSTAYMDIGSFENKSSLTINQIKDKATKDIDGRKVSSETGDSRYSVTIDRDGIRYHHKCIISGDNIVYYELVYPTEYSEVYDVYVSDIDETFDIAG